MSTSVLLTTDGTYPCYRGGVSVWCDQLMRELSEVEFQVLAISYSPSDLPLYKLPRNAVSCRIVPLWGTEEPGPTGEQFSSVFRRKLATTHSAIRTGFLKPFVRTLRALVQPGSAPEDLAGGLLDLYEFFIEHDYATSMRAQETWDAFIGVCLEGSSDREQLTLADATNCMRWVQRYLGILAVPQPKVDLVHASMAGLAAVPGVLAKLRHGSSFLLTEHGIYLREQYLSVGRLNTTVPCKRFLHGMSRALARMSYEYADGVSTLCEFNHRWQIRLGVDPAKVRTIPNGIDAASFSPASRRATERPTVLTVARIMPLKGIAYLVNAAAIVRERIPDVRFRVLGDVADSTYFAQCRKRVSECNLDSVVEFGQTTEPAAAYGAADVFCLPSISEALPFVVLEAMFSGCPVVATDVGGVAEMLGGTGILVNPCDPDGLARALLTLLDGPQSAARRQQLARDALVRAKARYTLRICVDGFREMYRAFTEYEIAAAVSAA